MVTISQIAKLNARPELVREFFSRLKPGDILTNAQVHAFFSADFASASMLLRRMISHGFAKTIDHAIDDKTTLRPIYYYYENLFTKSSKYIDDCDFFNLTNCPNADVYVVTGPYPMSAVKIIKPFHSFL